MPLQEYRRKRDFAATPEPAPGALVDRSGRFTIQRHRATALHYDVRLEIGGVLVSWAVPKGPTLDPSARRLAMRTEDHPIEYFDFEGIIPAKQYGAGDVIVWDHGCFYPQDKTLTRIPEAEADAAALAGLEKGDFKFELEGERLRGSWALVKMKGREENAWLLIKHNDTHADRERAVTDQKQSVVTGALLPRDRGEPSTAQRRRAAKK